MPSELNLSPPPTIPQARTYISKQMSEFTEYDVAKGTKIRIDIPRLQRSYLMKDSYIRFRLNLDLQASSTTKYPSIAFDKGGAYSLFDRIEVYDYLGGTLIEQTNNIPTLMALLDDLDYPFQDNFGKRCHNAGFGEPYASFEKSGVEYDTVDDDPGCGLNANQNGSRICGRSVADVASANVFYSREYCIPVLSFLGLFSDKYVPLHNGFSVYFYLNDPNQALISRSSYSGTDTITNSFTIKASWLSNFEYVCQIMELGEQAEAIVQSSQPLVIASKQYRHFTDTILGSGKQSSFRFDLNLNVVSLRNILFTMRPISYQNSIMYPSHGFRIRNYLENFNFQYGSSYLPEIAGVACRCSAITSSRNSYPTIVSQTINSLKDLGFTQALEELSKVALDPNLTKINNYYFMDVPVASKVPWSYQGYSTSTDPNNLLYVPIGQFAGGLNLRLSKKSTVCGIDTNGLQISINGNFDYDKVSLMVDAIMDVWAEHDSFIQIIPGVATTVTF